jgi:hypothetical protein
MTFLFFFPEMKGKNNDSEPQTEKRISGSDE